MANEEAPNFWFKNPLCPIFDRLYRYKFKLYRYNFATAIFLLSCTGTSLLLPVFEQVVPVHVEVVLVQLVSKLIFLFYIYIYIYNFFFFFHFWNSGATIHLDLFNCLSSQVFLPVHFFSCSNSTTDCIRRLSTVIHSWDIFKLSTRTTAVP